MQHPSFFSCSTPSFHPSPSFSAASTPDPLPPEPLLPSLQHPSSPPPSTLAFVSGHASYSEDPHVIGTSWGEWVVRGFGGGGLGKHNEDECKRQNAGWQLIIYLCCMHMTVHQLNFTWLEIVNECVQKCGSDAIVNTYNRTYYMKMELTQTNTTKYESVFSLKSTCWLQISPTTIQHDCRIHARMNKLSTLVYIINKCQHWKKLR